MFTLTSRSNRYARQPCANQATCGEVWYR